MAARRPAGGETSRCRSSALGERSCHEEGHLQGLHVVQARVADRLVALQKGFLVDRIGTPEALGDVVARHLHVQSTREGAQGVVHLEETPDLVDDVVEVAGLVPVR